MLHKHQKLGLWLPRGGHIDNELPDDAAVREVLEESGVPIELVGETALTVGEPRQLIRPRGIQLESIHEGHEPIDLIYLARPKEPYSGFLRKADPTLGWYAAQELEAMTLTEEVKAWAALALEALGETSSPVSGGWTRSS